MPPVILFQQPTPVLIALFHSIPFTKNGKVNPLSYYICEVLNSRGYDIQNLDFHDGKPSSSNRSSNCDEKGKRNFLSRFINAFNK